MCWLKKFLYIILWSKHYSLKPMKRYILLFFLTAAIPVSANMTADLDEVLKSEQVQPGPTITVGRHGIRIQGASGLKFEIYDITGKLVYSQQLDSPDKTIVPDVPKGVYIVRVGKYTRKLALD